MERRLARALEANQGCGRGVALALLDGSIRDTLRPVGTSLCNATALMWRLEMLGLGTAVALAAYGIGANYGVMLPFSRAHESEADHIGIIYMAKAGYDPAEAVRFWQRFGGEKAGGAPPEWLSTHPSDATRVRQLEELLPEAETLYKAA